MIRTARRIALTAAAALVMAVPSAASADTLNSTSLAPQTREHILLAKCSC